MEYVRTEGDLDCRELPLLAALLYCWCWGSPRGEMECCDDDDTAGDLALLLFLLVVGRRVAPFSTGGGLRGVDAGEGMTTCELRSDSEGFLLLLPLVLPAAVLFIAFVAGMIASANPNSSSLDDFAAAALDDSSSRLFCLFFDFFDSS